MVDDKKVVKKTASKKASKKTEEAKVEVKAVKKVAKKVVKPVEVKSSNSVKKSIKSNISNNESKKLGVVGYKITKNKTLSTSHKNTNKRWILIDATNAVCGRLGAYIVHHLNGKHLSSYTPNTDDGDNIVVINCDKIKFTGKKETQKLYRDHSEYVGNVRIRTAREVREGKRPTDLLRITVSRMLGRCKMSYKLVSKNLYLYAGAEHKQVAQAPIVIKFAELNRKNVVE